MRGRAALGVLGVLLAGALAACGDDDSKPRKTEAKLHYYDWEPNLFTSSGRLQSVAEVQRRGDKPAETPLPLFRAVERASKAKPRPEPEDIPPEGPAKDVVDRFRGDQRRIQEHYDRENDTGRDKYYLLHRDKRLLPAGEAKPTPPPGGRVIKVPRGILVVESESDPATGRRSNRHLVLEDDSELSGADITDPKQELDPASNQPVLTFQFTPKGQAAFERVTKRVARRGAELQADRPPGAPPSEVEQRFGIVLDDRVLSTPAIDFTELPQGIPGRNGAQISGLGDIEHVQDLARRLGGG